MIAFLSGTWSAELDRLARERPGQLGAMRNPDSGNAVADDIMQALENGCYAKGNRFQAGPWLGWLDTCPRSALFATVPVRELGHNPAYVLQNGVTDELVPWGSCGALFVGGDDLFKLGWTARHYVAEARARGIWTHMGRVNSRRRLMQALAAGYDSVDGTYLAYGPDKNLPQLLAWLDSANTQVEICA